MVVEDGGLPSSTMDVPTIPSLPMVATSTMLPSSSTVRIEQNPLPGKYTWRIGSPGLCSTFLSFRETTSSTAAMRL